MEGSRRKRPKTEKSSSSSVKREAFAHCFLRLQWSQDRKNHFHVRVWLTVFLDCNGVVHHKCLPQGRMVNKEYYPEVTCRLRKAIRQKHTGLWKNQGFCTMITHQLTHKCLWESFWPKTKPCLKHRIYSILRPLIFSSFQD